MERRDSKTSRSGDSPSLDAIAGLNSISLTFACGYIGQANVELPASFFEES